MSDTAVLDRQRPSVPRDTAALDGQRSSQDDSHGDTVSEQRPRESTSDDFRVPTSTYRHTQVRSECDPDDIVSLQPEQLLTS